MKQEILDRITALGGYTGQVTGMSLQADLDAIVLKKTSVSQTQGYPLGPGGRDRTH